MSVFSVSVSRVSLSSVSVSSVLCVFKCVLCLQGSVCVEKLCVFVCTGCVYMGAMVLVCTGLWVQGSVCGRYVYTYIKR